MNNENLIDDFENEIECFYKGETYTVRDNGAVLRHACKDKNPRPSDNVWTFGKYNKKTGYAEIAGERVHRIVATAFYGDAPSPQYVVDHIDTNRRNNRPENLRWITKLENILLNPITVKKIEFLCGSIENFLKDPSILRQASVDRNYEWMRAVNKEEALASLERMQSWAKSDKQLSGGTLGEWIYRRNSIETKVNTKIEAAEIPKETAKTVSDKAVASMQETLKPKPVRAQKSNPFGYQRDGSMIMYRTNSELFELIKRLLNTAKELKFPDIVLPTAGKGIFIMDSWTEEFQDIEYFYKGKSKTPKSITLHNENKIITLVIRTKSNSNEQEIKRLKDNANNIVEIDLSWAKDGVTESEMKHILQTDTTKKQWIYHDLIEDAKERLEDICEPICSAGGGVLHSYLACPLTSDSVQDIDCWYCDFHVNSERIIDGETHNCDSCFAKSGVKTYQDLLAISNVEKEDDKIISITYNKNDEIVTRRFDKEVHLPGKTIFQLWDERIGNKLIVHNIYSNWYVLIEEDPKVNFEKTNKVYAKLNRTVEGLEDSTKRSIFSFDERCWETVKQV